MGSYEWGREMVEHMSYAFRQANGKDTYELITPAENVERMQQFVMSDKEFKPNTKNSLLGDAAISAQKSSMQESIQELKEEIDAFFTYFKEDKDAVIMNPFWRIELLKVDCLALQALCASCKAI